MGGLVLGISAFYHDSAAALLDDGVVIAAAQEERFSRRKHDPRFPRHAIEYCLGVAAARLADVERVAFYDKPFLKFERLLETYLSFAPRGFESFRLAAPIWVREKLFLKEMLLKEFGRIEQGDGWNRQIRFPEHHLSHAASAFYPSPFEDAAVLTVDGVGEWSTTALSVGNGSRLEIVKELHFPHSLGLLYSAFTYYLGFKVNSGEYKVMGLAPYGTPNHISTILDHLIDLKGDGTFRLDQRYFEYCTGLRMTNDRFNALFGGPVRRPEDPLTQRHMDIAASIQAVTDEVMLRLTRSIAADTGARNLCLAGGVALNCVANGRILRDGRFERLWIQPAAGDAGGALGAALIVHHQDLGGDREPPRGSDGMWGSYLGPAFSQQEVEGSLRAAGASFEVLADEVFFETVADALASGQAVGWFQGRMEFGPRALGARSILADPRSASMQSTLNLKVKFRESFRPFAPSVLRESASDWFDLDEESPYMLLVADVASEHRLDPGVDDDGLFGIERLKRPRSSIPAVTHVDGSARVQTVERTTNARYHELIRRFGEKTGCPVLVNTSFNIRGEPIVCTPEDAFRCFMGTDLDLLAIENCVLRKEDQDSGLHSDYRDQVVPD